MGLPLRASFIGLSAGVLLLFTVLTGFYLGNQTRAQFREIAASWSDYATDAERKGVWISSIRGHLGYGGIIHTFKNYVLRGDDAYRARMIEQLAHFHAAVDNYLATLISPAERAALETIRATIAEYEAKLPIAARAAAADWPVERTDALVRVDDTEAIRALNTLEVIWQENRLRSTERIVAAVARGEALIGAGFVGLLALTSVALLLGFLMLLLMHDVRRALTALSAELQARLRLERSEHQLAEAVEQSPAAIVITDTEGRIQYTNRRFEALTGWSRDEIVGRTAKALQLGDTPPEIYAEMRACLDRSEIWRGVLRNRRKDGGTYWVETAVLPLVSPDGQVRSYIGIGEDVTEKRRAREQVARAQKMEAVGLLAGGIAHDFNNILTTILGAAHLAGLDAPPDSDLAGEIDQIDIAARRGQSVVRQLLTFARRQPGKPVATDLRAVILEVTRLQRAATPQSIILDWQDEGVPVRTVADPTHLHQILMNLYRNAVEAIEPERGTIRIRAEQLEQAPDGLAPRAEGWVQLVVEDDGPGMSVETLRNVFDPFFTTKPLGKGTGLGLAVVQTLVQEISGHVRAESEPGKGSRFVVVLPRTEMSPETEAAEHVELPHGSETILVVDDEPEVAAMFRRFLMRLGYQVEAFTSPLAALQRFRADPTRPDLVISDMVMPDMNGEAFAAEVRRLRPDCPLIICSAYHTRSARLPGSEPDFIDKPVHPPRLALRVRAMLDRAAPAA
jgi:PAS domain S-box-containing protein